MASIVIKSLGGRGDQLPNIVHDFQACPIVLGRDEGCDIQVIDPQVSRRHVEISMTTQGGHDIYFAADLGASNGTVIDGHPVKKQIPLKEGSIIAIGRSELIFTKKKFKDRDTALAAFRRDGEQYKGTIIT